MHRLIKPKKTTAPSVVWEAGPEGHKRVSTDQANADAQRRKWTKIWDAHKTPRARIAEKMKGGEDDPGRNRARQTPMRERVDALRATVRAIKHHTAMSHDPSSHTCLGRYLMKPSSTSSAYTTDARMRVSGQRHEDNHAWCASPKKKRESSD